MSNQLMSNQQISNVQPHGSDAENLSALFDGQLGGDAARFALKRLGHEAEWREACGRWQLAGDVLRGDSVAPAPGGFAARVMEAVAREQEQERAAFAGTVAGRGRRVRAHPRWIGGALAASVAIAALFVARPMFENEDALMDAPAGRELVSAGSGATSTQALAANDFTGAPAAPVPTAPAASTDTAAGLAAAALAATAAATTETPRRRRAPVATRGADIRPARTTRSAPVTAVAAIEPSPPPAASARPATAHPFMPAGDIVARPWPQAVLPGYRADTTMTAGFHAGGSGAAPISFYPFEPAGLRGQPAHNVDESIRTPLPPPSPQEPVPAAATRH